MDQGHNEKVCNGCLREEGRAPLGESGIAIGQGLLNEAGFHLPPLSLKVPWLSPAQVQTGTAPTHSQKEKKEEVGLE